MQEDNHDEEWNQVLLLAIGMAQVKVAQLGGIVLPLPRTQLVYRQRTALMLCLLTSKAIRSTKPSKLLDQLSPVARNNVLPNRLSISTYDSLVTSYTPLLLCVSPHGDSTSTD